MGLRINTNIQSLAAQRNLSNNTAMQNKSLEKLASGQRINRAGDDAAGLAISEKLRANIRSMRQAIRNGNDGISLIQTAEGAFNEISNITVRLRELSIQSANDTLSDVERGFVNKEVQHLKGEVQRIANSTEFNGLKMLDGSSPALEFQIGPGNDSFKDRIVLNTQEYVVTLDGLGLREVDAGTKASSQANLEMIDQAIYKINQSRAGLGALQNRLGSAIQNATIYKENLEGANSRIRDTDMAEEVSELTKSNILTQANISVLAQANQNSNAALKLLN